MSINKKNINKKVGGAGASVEQSKKLLTLLEAIKKYSTDEVNMPEDAKDWIKKRRRMNKGVIRFIGIYGDPKKYKNETQNIVKLYKQDINYPLLGYDFNISEEFLNKLIELLSILFNIKTHFAAKISNLGFMNKKYKNILSNYSDGLSNIISDVKSDVKLSQPKLYYELSLYVKHYLEKGYFAGKVLYILKHIDMLESYLNY